MIIKVSGEISTEVRDALLEVVTSSFPHAVLVDNFQPDSDNWEMVAGDRANEFKFAHEVRTMREVLDNCELTQYVKFEDVPDPVIHNVAEFMLAVHDYEVADRDPEVVQAAASKYTFNETECGANITLLPNGIVLGSVIEGSDSEIDTDTLVYPFKLSEYYQTIDYIEGEVKVTIAQEEAEDNDNTDSALDLLEELLSITERLKPHMDSSERDAWSRISADAADLRDGIGEDDEW